MSPFKLTLALLITALNLSAQDGVSLKGKITDSQDWPIEYAAVCLYIHDTILYKGTITDYSGNFEITDIDKNLYSLIISHISYATNKLDSIVADTLDINLRTVILDESTTNLKEATVKAEMNNINLSKGKMIYKISEGDLNRSSTMEQLVNSIPSLSYDQLSGLQLDGKSNVLILVNGIRFENVDITKVLQPNQIDKIEIMKNPPIQYANEGFSSIISITLKNISKGGNGHIFGNVPNKISDYSLSNTTQLRKFSMFQSGSFNLHRYKYDMESSLINNNSENFNQIDNGKLYKYNAFFQSFNDYQINKYNKINAGARLKFSRYNSEDKIYYNIQNTNNNISVIENENDVISGSIYANYTSEIKSLKSKITNEFIYNRLTDNDNYYDKSYDINNENTKQLIKTKGNTYVYNIKMEKVVSESFDFEAGIKDEYNDIMSDWNYSDLLIKTKYKNNLLLGFTNFYIQIGELGLTAGLSLQNEDFRIDSIKNQYRTFNPGLSIDYEMADHYTMNISYERIVASPLYWELDPNPVQIDSNNIIVGNPDLKSYYENDLDINFSYNKAGIYLAFTTGYILTKDIISEISEPDNQGIIISSYKNLNTFHELYERLDVKLKITPWLRLNGNIKQYNQYLTFDDTQKTVSSLSTNFYFMFELPYKINFSTQFRYNGMKVLPYGRTTSPINLSLYLSKNILKDKGTVGITWIQPFIDHSTEKRIENGYIYNEKMNVYYSTVSLYLNYRFSYGKKPDSKRHDIEWIENEKEKKL